VRASHAAALVELRHLRRCMSTSSIRCRMGIAVDRIIIIFIFIIFIIFIIITATITIIAAVTTTRMMQQNKTEGGILDS